MKRKQERRRSREQAKENARREELGEKAYESIADLRI